MENNSRDLYKSLPLQHSQIRLLRVLPGPEASKIKLELYVTPLESSESFNYLCYCWGEPEGGQAILCNEQPGVVRLNLHQCLRQLRSRQWAQPLWVDSFCINQGDAVEKAQQVSLIPDITRKASTTILWLGQGSHDIELFFQYCQGRHHLPRPTKGLRRGIESGLLEVMENIAFHRIWPLQGIIHARDLKVWYGPSECLHEDLIQVLHASYQDSKNPIARSSASTTIVLIDEFRRRYQAGQQITFTEMVQASRNFLCTSPKDRVTASINVTRARPTIEIDFTSSTVKFYTATARMINHEIFPASLSMLEDKRKAINLPSWVPNLDVPVQRKMLIQTLWRFSASTNFRSRLTIFRDGISIVDADDPYNLYDADDPYDYYDDSSSSFTPKGFVTDTLMDVFDYNPARQWYDERNLLALNNSFLAMWLDSALDTPPTDELAKEKAFVEFIETIQALPSDQIQRDAAERMETAKVWLSAIQGESDQITKKMKDFHEACTFAFGRRFGVTSQGRFCLIPKNSQPRDSVCILVGSTVPFILRRLEHGWMNIGECYVHGIMNGEAVNRDTDEVEPFEIC